MEDRGRDGVRRRLRHVRSGRLARADARRRALRRAPAARLRRRGADGPARSRRLLPAHDAARLAAGVISRSRSSSSPPPRRELYEPLVPLAAGAAVRRLGRALGPRAPDVAGDRAAARASPWRCTASRSRCGGQRPAARCWASASPSRSSRAASSGPLWLALTAAVAAARLRRAGATAAYALTVAVALVVAVPLAASWPLALAPARLAASRRVVGRRIASATISRRSRRTRRATRSTSLKNLPVVRVAGAAARAAGRCGPAGAASTAASRTPGIVLPGTLALVILVGLLVMAEPRAIVAMPLLVPLALLASLEVDSLTRGFSGALDWFGILTFGLLRRSSGGSGSTPTCTACRRRSRALFRDTETGYQPTFHWLAIAVSLFLTVLWIVLVRPARRSNRRAVLNWAVGVTLVWGALHDDLAAVPRFAPQLPLVVAGARAGAAARGDASRAATWASRSARCSTISATSSPCARSRRRATACRSCSCSSAARTTWSSRARGWEIAWEGSRRGDDTERFVALPPGAAVKFVDEAVIEVHRRRRRQRLPSLPAREVRAARRPRRRRRRPRRQHPRRRRPQHQHADRLPLRPHPPARRAARTAAAPTSTARARTTSCCACRSAPSSPTPTPASRSPTCARTASAPWSRSGGKGGLGNIHFKSSTNRAPRQCTTGRGRARRRAAPRAQGAGRRRPARHAERRQEHADPRGLGGAAQGRRLPVHDARARTSASCAPTTERSFVVADIPGPDRGRRRRRRPRHPVPAPPAAHAPAAARRRPRAARSRRRSGARRRRRSSTSSGTTTPRSPRSRAGWC